MLEFVYTNLRGQERVQLGKLIDPSNPQNARLVSLDIEATDPNHLALLPYIDTGVEEAKEMDRVLQNVLNALKFKANEYLSTMNPTIINTCSNISGTYPSIIINPLGFKTNFADTQKALPSIKLDDTYTERVLENTSKLAPEVPRVTNFGLTLCNRDLGSLQKHGQIS